MKLRVLYLYAGARRKIYEEYKSGKTPGIDLVGLNHMAENGIDATFLENRLTEFFRRISFNLTQLPVFLHLHKYDVIFAGSGIFTLFLMKYVLRLKRPKWVIYNTYLTNLLKRNKKELKAWVIRKAVFSADAIISPSWSQCEVLKNEGLPAEKNYDVPYGINYEFFNKAGAGSAESTERYILSSGRDIGRDYQTLIKAVDGLPVKLLVATLPRNLSDITEMPANVEVAHFNQEKMTALIKNAAFVAIPTIGEEHLVGSDCSGQYALLRSMTCGKAVITSERSTLKEYFTSGVHGLTVKPQNVEALREAIMTLWNDPEKANAMGKAAQEKIKKELTIEIFSAKIAQIFKEVAAR